MPSLFGGGDSSKARGARETFLCRFAAPPTVVEVLIRRKLKNYTQTPLLAAWTELSVNPNLSILRRAVSAFRVVEGRLIVESVAALSIMFPTVVPRGNASTI